MTKLSEKIITYEQRKKEFENWMGRVYIPGVHTPKENPNVDFRLAVEDLNRQRAEREAELEQLKGRVEAQDKIAFRGKIDKQFIDRVINTTIETVLEPFGEYAAKPTTNKVIRPLFEDILRPAMRKIIDELKKLEPEEPPIESEPMPGTMEGFQ
jgi:GTPase SAR1 family protein